MIGFPKKTTKAPVIPKNPIHPDTGLPLNITEELIKCAQDPVYFINTYAYTKSSKSGTIPFKLYDFQKECIRDFIMHPRNVILKSRQMGISWLSAAYIAWFIIFQPSRDVLCIANKQKTATKMVDKVKFVIKYLPEWMKYHLNVASFAVDNRESIHLFNNSKLEASATTEDAARGDTLSLLVIDEAAMIRNAEETWKSMEPTLEIGGDRVSCIVLSTPKGIGNWFHTLFTDAENEVNGFNPIVLGWELHPDRCKYPGDETWAIKKIKERGERLFAQEYACQFEQSGNSLIKGKKLISIEENWVCNPNQKGEAETQGLWIWENAVPGRQYIVAADPAGGGDVDEVITDDEDAPTSESDFSAAVVIDCYTKRVVAEYYGKAAQVAFCRLLYGLCQTYNTALFVYDKTGGYAGSFFENFSEWGYTRIYRQPKNTTIKFQVNLLDMNGKPGFTITKQNRDTIVSNLEEFLVTREDDDPLFYSRRILNEFKTFIWNGKRKKYEAMSGKHDDLIMAMAIGYYVLVQWNYYHGSGQSSMTEAILHGLHSSRPKTPDAYALIKNALNPVESGQLPVTLNGLRKHEQKFKKAYVDPKTGEDLRPMLIQSTLPKKPENSVEEDTNDPTRPQKSAFEHFSF